MKYLIFLVGLLSCTTDHTASAPRQPAGRPVYPRFREPQRRRLRHYKPKTWRERAPEPRPADAGPAGKPK